MVIPSILPQTIEEFQDKLARVAPFAKRFHLDITDGKLFEGTSLSWEQCVSILSDLPFELHLMILNPEQTIDIYIRGRPVLVWLHAESSFLVPSVVEKVKREGFAVGVAISPETPVDQVVGFVEQTGNVLVMTIHPGKTGQRFLPDVLAKVTVLKRKFPKALIGVDGGITPQTIALAARAGANHFVSSSYIFGQPSVAVALADLESAAGTLYH